MIGSQYLHTQLHISNYTHHNTIFITSIFYIYIVFTRLCYFWGTNPFLPKQQLMVPFNPCLVFIPSLYLGSSQVKPLGKYGAGIKTFRCNKEYHCEHLKAQINLMSNLYSFPAVTSVKTWVSTQLIYIENNVKLKAKSNPATSDD